MSSQLFSRYRRVIARLTWLFALWLGVIAVLGLAITANAGWAALVAVVVLGALAWRRRARRDETALAARAALLVGLAGAAVHQAGPDPLLLVGISVLVAVLLGEEPAALLLKPPLVAYQLPGLSQPWWARLGQPLYATASLGTAVLGVATAASLPAPLTGAAIIVAAGVGLGITALQVLRRRRHLAEKEIRRALTQWAPGYYFVFDGKPEAAYQLQMWLRYVANTGERGALIVRDPRFLQRARQLTDLPIVLAERVEPIESLLVDSVGAFFYVNNSARNADGTRYPQVTHVHLGHGDSDKPSSYAASTAMFDQIFVAGQAGADRFASHGVDVPAGKFVLVGRPQAEEVQARTSAALPERPTVLYAPTWRGVLADMQLSSLDHGARLVEALLAAGARVIFRPHPFSARDATSRALINTIDGLLNAAGGDHLTSDAARALSIFDCMNASDAMVTDISSVASDYLYSDKPLALTYRGDPAAVSASYPLAAAAELLDLDGDLAAAIVAWLADDAQAPRRAETRRYYLGPWSSTESVEVFTAAATAAINQGRGR